VWCPITVAQTPVPTEEMPETIPIRPRFGPRVGPESIQNQSRINPEPSGASPGGPPGGPPRGTPKRTPQETPQGTLQGTPRGIPRGIPRGQPKKIRKPGLDFGGFLAGTFGRFWSNPGNNTGSGLLATGQLKGTRSPLLATARRCQSPSQEFRSN
jgi:hypothetical protein